MTACKVALLRPGNALLFRVAVLDEESSEPASGLTLKGMVVAAESGTAPVHEALEVDPLAEGDVEGGRQEYSGSIDAATLIAHLMVGTTYYAVITGDGYRSEAKPFKFAYTDSQAVPA